MSHQKQQPPQVPLQKRIAKEKIELLEDPLPMWRYDADGFPHRYGKIMFIHEVVKKMNEVIEAVNEMNGR